MTYMHVLYKYIKFVYIDTNVQIKYIIYKCVGDIYIYMCMYIQRVKEINDSEINLVEKLRYRMTQSILVFK